MKYAWQIAYENAIFEKDPAKRPAQIASAETIMYRRQTILGRQSECFRGTEGFTDRNSEART